MQFPWIEINTLDGGFVYSTLAMLPQHLFLPLINHVFLP